MPHNDENWLNGKIEHIKRTEQEIFDDFEKLGWFVSIKSKREIILRRNPEKYTAIWIDKLTKEYLSNAYLSITEHKLLHELFTIWGWLDE